jgi:ribonuclease HI
LVLRAAKEMEIEEIAVFRDAELIIQQVRKTYQAKHPRLRSYINEVWDFIEQLLLSFQHLFYSKGEKCFG